MTNTKMTYVTALTKAIELIDRDLCSTIDASESGEWEAVVEKLTALKEQTEKRNSADRKPTKAQALNAELSEVVADVLAGADKPMTVSEIMAADDRLSGLSNQKVSAVLRVMGDRVVKTTDKRKSYFALA